MDTTQVAKYTTNMKALNSLMYALSPNEYNKISAYRTAKEVWDKLETMHEGTSQVKKTKISLLMHEYETFSMHEHATISQMHERYTVIINNLRRLGKTLSNEEQVERIVRCMPKKWEPNLATLEGNKSWEGTQLEDLIRALATQELKFEKK